ncbi:MAG: PhoH family protein [Acidobacteriota bacterium]
MTVAESAARAICGPNDGNLARIERAFGVEVTARGAEFLVTGNEASVFSASRLLEDLSTLIESGRRLSANDFKTSIRVIQEQPDSSLIDFFGSEGVLAAASRFVEPRSLVQQQYIRAMLEHDLVISVGPAGTGKTYLAVALAAASLVEKKVRRIVLARPAVEAGEKLGFLPGDLAEKVNPYLRPLYDALYDILGFDKVSRMIEREIIEVAPLAFMRGRTLNDAFIILDEAQNTTPEQMKMFLTRIGFGSKAVINGDVTQIDLPSGRRSGLVDASQVLQDVEGIAFVRFGRRDVVRHDLVQRIVTAYGEHDARREHDAPETTPEGGD